MIVNNRNGRIMALTLLGCLLAATVTIGMIEKSRYANERERIRYITSNQAGEIQYMMNMLLQKTQTLEMLVVQGGGKIKNFEKAAAKLMDSPAIQSLQLAPGGVVTQVFPKEGNDMAYGDIFAMPDRAADAIAARDTGQLTMSGPFDLAQGGFGLVGRQPIYIENARGETSFWGFSIVVLTLRDALMAAELDQLEEEGFSYNLRRASPDSQQAHVFAWSAAPLAGDPVEVSFKLPNAVWTLSVTPESGWTNYAALAVEILLGALLSVLIVSLEYMVLNLNIRKKELEQISKTDALTGLFNRRMFQELLECKCGNKARNFIFCYMDLNDFKAVNDSYGHAIGDCLLVECAKRMRACLKQGDLLFRVGGDEFAAIIDSEPSEEAYQERICAMAQKVAEPMRFAGYTIYASVSIGYAAFPRDAVDCEQLIQSADRAMYRMKTEYKKGRVTG